jgi:hypothetical protein
VASGNRFVSFYPNALRDDETSSYAEADAETIQSVAGRSQWLHEWATGGPPTIGEEPRVPRNPRGLYGHDHSGPPFGSAFRHPLFTWSASRASFGGWSNYDTEMLIDASAASVVFFSGRVFVRRFPGYITDTPYSRCYVQVRLVCDSGTRQIAVHLKANDDEDYQNTSVTAGTTAVTFSLSRYLRMRPGWNTIKISLRGEAAGAITRVCAIAGSQIVKRSH